MPYDQSPGGLQALCTSDQFGVSAGDFVTGGVYNPPGFGDTIVFSNVNGIFLTSNLFGFLACAPPQIVQTTAGASTNFGPIVTGNTLPFAIVAPGAILDDDDDDDDNDFDDDDDDDD